MKGNSKDGFKDLSSLKHIQHYTDIEYFNGDLYLASNKGIMDSSGKVTITGTVFDFEASGPVKITGEDIDLN